MSIPKIATYALPLEAQWPANRVSWQPDPHRAALLVHDMQDYFLSFYDRAAEPIPELIANIQRLRQTCQAAGVPVFYTAQPGQQAPHDRALLQEWWGPGITAVPEQAQVISALAPSAHDTVLTKWRYSAFAKSDLQQQLAQRGRDQLIVCGIYAHIGVLTTCVDAFMRDVQPFLVADAVADFSRADHDLALRWVSGRCGVVTSVNAVCLKLQPAPAPYLYADEQALLLDVAQTMEIPASDLCADDNLIDMGLDSVRLMALVSRWKKAGCTVDFTGLAKVPSVRAWWPLLTVNSPAAAEEE